MWISRKKWNALEKRVTDLEVEVQGQLIKNEVIFEFCRSAANKEKLSLLSYQQLYSPSADSCQKIRLLFEKIQHGDADKGSILPGGRKKQGRGIYLRPRKGGERGGRKKSS